MPAPSPCHTRGHIEQERAATLLSFRLNTIRKLPLWLISPAMPGALHDEDFIILAKCSRPDSLFFVHTMPKSATATHRPGGYNAYYFSAEMLSLRQPAITGRACSHFATPTSHAIDNGRISQCLNIISPEPYSSYISLVATGMPISSTTKFPQMTTKLPRHRLTYACTCLLYRHGLPQMHYSINDDA